MRRQHITEKKVTIKPGDSILTYAHIEDLHGGGEVKSLHTVSGGWRMIASF
jgi:hypothetical protein